jgi:prepilin-type N-terminal cleavage/methylation domain-containing protein
VQKTHQAFTLIEMLVTVALSSMVFAAVMVAYSFAHRSFAAVGTMSEFNQTSVLALDTLMNDVRNACQVLALSQHELILDQGSGIPPVTLTFNANAKTLTRTQSAVDKVLLRDCSDLSFSMYQRTPMAGSLLQYPAATIAAAKVIHVSWSCARATSYGVPSTTVDHRSSNIVLRN